MRALILALSILFGSACATSSELNNNQQNQEYTHPVCVEAQLLTMVVQREMDSNGVGAQAYLNYCGPLAPPHQSLGIALLEATVPVSSTEVKHSFYILKFANNGHEWILIAAPEPVVDFIHGQGGTSDVQPQSNLSL